MTNRIAYLSLPKGRVTENRTNQIGCRSARALAYAQPLFDAHVTLFGIYERRKMQLHRRFVPGVDHQFFYVWQGTLSYCCGEKTLTASQNMIMVLPANHPYKRIRHSKNLRFIYFRIEASPAWSSISEGEAFVKSYHNLDLLYVLVGNVLNQHMESGWVERRESLEYSSMIASLLRREIAYARKGKSEESRLGDLLERLRQEPEKKWTLQGMADALSVSTSTLNRLFRKHYHNSPMELVIKLRMERAVFLLLEERLNIGEIAKMVGYTKEATFSDLFLRYLGERPGQFRKSRKLSE